MSEDRVHNVFENELLLDNILKYVIQDDDDSNEISYANGRCCRLVSKSWKNSVSRILCKCRKPLFRLRLTKENSLIKSAAVVESGKCLDNFVSCLSGTSTSPLPNQLPTFQLTVCADFFRQENEDSLFRCLSLCGSSLVDLFIYFPKNGGSMRFIFPNLTFPLLMNLTMTVEDSVHMELDEGESFLGTGNGAYFLHFLLLGCEDLQYLEVGCDDGTFPIPNGIDRLSLPPTLTTFIWLNFIGLNNKHYEILLRNEFPKLKKLSFPIGATSLAHGMIFKILDNVKTMLTHLIVSGSGRKEPEQSTYFRLPLIEHLKIFETKSRSLTLEDDVSMLQNDVPNILKLSLERQTTTMFRKWTESSRYVSVRELTAWLVNEDHSRLVSFQSPMMRLVEMAFPNIETLKLTVCGTDLCGLTHAFQHLKTLQSLKVTLVRSKNILNSDCWDALLIGTSVAFAAALRTTRNDWNDVKFGPNINHRSIKNLMELRKLDLHEFIPTDSPLGQVPLISDVAFHFAFLNMPRLKKIRLNGRFMVSAEMLEKWSDQITGRCIKYFRY